MLYELNTLVKYTTTSIKIIIKKKNCLVNYATTNYEKYYILL